MEGSIMNRKTRVFIHGAVITIFICMFGTIIVQAAEYAALKGLNDVKVVFDVRSKKVKSAAIQLDLIHQTYNDPALRKITAQPQFIVVFGGAAVQFVSSNTEGFSADEKELIGPIARKIGEMKKEGIQFEICMFAADLYNVDPATVLPEIQQVGNGWISLIGYQATGYSLVAAY